MTVPIGNARARSPLDIRCSIRGKKDTFTKKAMKCPEGRGESRTKFRGKNKCWGCDYAYWSSGSLRGQRYGPRRGIRRKYQP